MGNNQKITGRADSIPVGLAVGTACSILFTIASVTVLAKLLDNGKLQWENIGYGIMIQTMIVSFIGAKVSYARIKRQRLMICLLSGVIYYGILMATAAIFFGGQYDGMGVTALLVLAGCASASLLGLRLGKAGQHRIKKIQHR